MNKKPILIITGVLILALCVFLFIRSKKLARPEEKEVIAFLGRFNADLNTGVTDTLLNYFDDKRNQKQLIKLLGLLSNKTNMGGKEKPLLYAKMFPGDAAVTIVNTELTNAIVPVILNEEHANNAKISTILIKLRKISPGHFKIIQIDARDFVKDYLAYENAVKQKINNDDDGAVTYSPLTLEAFKAAEQLKTRYDSVLWFAYIDKKTYYYVVKGKWESPSQFQETAALNGTYKMGLLDPQLKELIPVEYDLIHTIGASLPQLVEVEKGDKKGFYDMTGKLVLPVIYDQVFPIDDDVNLAVLQKDKQYFYLKKDMSVSEGLDLKLANFIARVKFMSGNYDLYKAASELPVLMEYNSHQYHSALYVPPSYLAYLTMTGKIEEFKNPTRKMRYEETHTKYNVSKADVKTDNWLTASFYSIRDYFLGGRAEFYDRKNVVIVDNKSNRVFSHSLNISYGSEMGDDTYTGQCDVSGVKMINDSLLEVRAIAAMNTQLYDTTQLITGGVFYHYFMIRNNQLTELSEKRMFGFTKYVKMDDSYMNGCYDLLIGLGNYDTRKKSEISQITPEMLRYIKNEIYASYRYQFKDKRWRNVFAEMSMEYDSKTNKEKPLNANVDDSLTVIDKYNLNWIANKLKQPSTKQLQIKQPQSLAAQ